MSKKAFYSDEDIEVAKSALAGLPDLTPQRKSQKEFLDAIRDDLLALVKTKGYTVFDIRETLKTTGYEISERALREIVRDAEKNKPARKKRKLAANSASTESK